MAKRTFTPIRPVRRGAELLEAIESQLEAVPSALPALNANSTRSLMKPEVQTAHPRIEDDALPRPAPFVLRLSPDVFRQIDAKAVESGVTMTVVIARALVGAGFALPDDDLKDRRKRRYRG